jgi:hypothetical protein
VEIPQHRLPDSRAWFVPGRQLSPRANSVIIESRSSSETSAQTAVLADHILPNPQPGQFNIVNHGSFLAPADVTRPFGTTPDGEVSPGSYEKAYLGVPLPSATGYLEIHCVTWNTLSNETASDLQKWAEQKSTPRRTRSDVLHRLRNGLLHETHVVDILVAANKLRDLADKLDNGIHITVEQIVAAVAPRPVLPISSSRSRQFREGRFAVGDMTQLFVSMPDGIESDTVIILPYRIPSTYRNVRRENLATANLPEKLGEVLLMHSPRLESNNALPSGTRAIDLPFWNRICREEARIEFHLERIGRHIPECRDATPILSARWRHPQSVDISEYLHTIVERQAKWHPMQDGNMHPDMRMF